MIALVTLWRAFLMAIAERRERMKHSCKKHKTHHRDCTGCRTADNVAQKALEHGVDYAVAYEKLVGYPCQRGEKCEWATRTGVNITCSRIIAGCVKV